MTLHAHDKCVFHPLLVTNATNGANACHLNILLYLFAAHRQMLYAVDISSFWDNKDQPYLKLFNELCSLHEGHTKFECTTYRRIYQLLKELPRFMSSTNFTPYGQYGDVSLNYVYFEHLFKDVVEILNMNTSVPDKDQSMFRTLHECVNNYEERHPSKMVLSIFTSTHTSGTGKYGSNYHFIGFTRNGPSTWLQFDAVQSGVCTWKREMFHRPLGPNYDVFLICCKKHLFQVNIPKTFFPTYFIRFQNSLPSRAFLNSDYTPITFQRNKSWRVFENAPKHLICQIVCLGFCSKTKRPSSNYIYLQTPFVILENSSG